MLIFARHAIVICTVLAICCDRGRSLKFHMVFNVDKNKADLTISEESDFDMTLNTNLKNSSHAEKPVRKATTSAPPSTVVTSEKSTTHPWQEIDETRMSGKLDWFDFAPYPLKNVPFARKNSQPEIEPDAATTLTATVLAEEKTERYEEEEENRGDCIRIILKDDRDIMIILSLLREEENKIYRTQKVATKTEIVYPSCLAFTSVPYRCDQQKVVDSTPVLTKEPLSSTVVNNNLHHIDSGFNVGNAWQDIKPSQTVDYFSTLFSFPIIDNGNDLETSIIEIPYDDFGSHMIWRRSSAGTSDLPADYRYLVFSSAAAGLEPSESSSVVINESPSIKYHLETLEVTRVEKRMDFATTVTVLGDCLSSVTDLPICQQPISNPPKGALSSKSPSLLKPSIEKSVSNVYHLINKTLIEQNSVSSSTAGDGYYEVVEETTSAEQPIGISDHDDESRHVEHVSDRQVSL